MADSDFSLDGTPLLEGDEVICWSRCKIRDGSPYSKILIRPGTPGTITHVTGKKIGIRFKGRNKSSFFGSLILERVTPKQEK